MRRNNPCAASAGAFFDSAKWLRQCLIRHQCGDNSRRAYTLRDKREEAPAESPQPGLALPKGIDMQRKNSGRLSCRHLTELQGLCQDGLFVVPPAAAETNRCRKDDRASYEDTHRILRPYCFPAFSRHHFSVPSARKLWRVGHTGTKKSCLRRAGLNVR